MHQANHVFLMTLAMVAFGYLLKRFSFIREEEGKTITKFLMHTTFPALVLISAIRLKLSPDLFLIPLTAFLFGGVMVAVAWFVFKGYPNRLRGLLTMAMGGWNMGLFAFPIIEGIWGRDALAYAVMFDIGNTFVVFGLVYTSGSYFASEEGIKVNYKNIFKKIISLPPFQALLIGLIINAFSIPMPKIATDLLDTFAQGNKPIVMTLMGIYLGFTFNKKQIQAVSIVLASRYVAGFGVVAWLLYGLPPSMLRNTLILCFILPVGLTLLPFADELNYDSKMAGLLVNLSLLISFILMWGLVLGLKMV